ncbi:MAG: hypothetical protein Q9217_003254 [Psora testacea]
MSYNHIVQLEDSFSESDYSEVRASTLSHDNNSIHPRSASGTMSPNLELQSLRSETSSRPRTVSRDGSGPMQHPTPDLQTLQGAYVTNIERLEESAERLSLSADIGEEIRKMREEQKRSDSRRSSILNPHPEEGPGSPALHCQSSYGYGSHASNSIVGTNNVARSGGFSPAAYFASPKNSVRSGSWSHQNSVKGRSASQEPRLTLVTEPEQEGKPLDSPMSTRFTSFVPPPDSLKCSLQITNDGQCNFDDIVIPKTESPKLKIDEGELRMAEAAEERRRSTDTTHQRNSLFLDFDGVHAVAQPDEPQPQKEPLDGPRSSPMLNGRPQSFLEPTPGESIVYYPAPVPMMLNLPNRLSKMPAITQREKRRSELLGNLPANARKSAAWLPGMPEGSEELRKSTDDERDVRPEEHKRRATTDLPPQLRASMFFDYPAAKQNVEVKGESAVATLDSILDASAFAPVSAFTDHPIVGRVGAEVYGRAPGPPKASHEVADSRRRSSTINLLTQKESSSNLLDDTRKRNSLMSIGKYFGRSKSNGPQLDESAQYHNLEAVEAEHNNSEDDDYVNAQGEVDEARQEDDETPPFELQPTTLLAELQMRKQEQKLRNRTAATAFPHGMHSTLLQLDAVAQVQKQARKQKHTTLAWEDPEAHHPGGDSMDDEDVPLGMLYPGQQLQGRREEEDRPLGLIAQRQMEDNEPLSHRRARLRGEDPSLRNLSLVQQNPMYSQELPHLATNGEGNVDEDDDRPGETLAQRIRRIKATRIPSQPRPVSGDFASEMMSQLGGLSPSAQLQEAELAEPTRNTTKTPELEEETLGQRRKRLQAESAAKSRNVSGDSNGAPAPSSTLPQRRSMADLLQAHPAAGGAGQSVSNALKFAPAPKTRNTAWAMHVNQQAGRANASALNGLGYVNGGGYAPHPMVAGHHRQQKPVEADLRQRDMIDRWRQSVMY